MRMKNPGGRCSTGRGWNKEEHSRAGTVYPTSSATSTCSAVASFSSVSSVGLAPPRSSLATLLVHGSNLRHEKPPAEWAHGRVASDFVARLVAVVAMRTVWFWFRLACKIGNGNRRSLFFAFAKHESLQESAPRRFVCRLTRPATVAPSSRYRWTSSPTSRTAHAEAEVVRVGIHGA